MCNVSLVYRAYMPAFFPGNKITLKTSSGLFPELDKLLQSHRSCVHMAWHVKSSLNYKQPKPRIMLQIWNSHIFYTNSKIRMISLVCSDAPWWESFDIILEGTRRLTICVLRLFIHSVKLCIHPQIASPGRVWEDFHTHVSEFCLLSGRAALMQALSECCLELCFHIP